MLRVRDSTVLTRGLNRGLSAGAHAQSYGVLLVRGQHAGVLELEHTTAKSISIAAHIQSGYEYHVSS